MPKLPFLQRHCTKQFVDVQYVLLSMCVAFLRYLSLAEKDTGKLSDAIQYAQLLEHLHPAVLVRPKYQRYTSTSASYSSSSYFASRCGHRPAPAGDVRESAAAYVAKALLTERAECHAYDPKVTREAFLWELEYTNGVTPANTPLLDKLFHVDSDAYVAAAGSDAVCILTEWNLFKELDWQRIFDSMRKPAFVFDGRGILNHTVLRAIGFEVHAVGKDSTVAHRDGTAVPIARFAPPAAAQ